MLEKAVYANEYPLFGVFIGMCKEMVQCLFSIVLGYFGNILGFLGNLKKTIFGLKKVEEHHVKMCKNFENTKQFFRKKVSFKCKQPKKYLQSLPFSNFKLLEHLVPRALKSTTKTERFLLRLSRNQTLTQQMCHCGKIVNGHNNSLV